MPVALTGDICRCTFGLAPSSIITLDMSLIIKGKGVVTVMDFIPGMNILPFGMCNSPSNPEVIAATAAALGVLTPAPCMPVTVTPWAPARINIIVQGKPVVDAESQLLCMWEGVIKVVATGII